MMRRELRIVADAGMVECFRSMAPDSAARLLRYQELEDSCADPIWVLPDLGPDEGMPVGTTLVTRETILPLAIGMDPGCGYAGWVLRGERKHLTVDVLRRWLDRAVYQASPSEASTVADQVFEGRWPEPGHRLSRRLRSACEKRLAQDLGLLSPGNHFLEIHAIGDVVPGSPVNEEDALMVVHNGSMGVGRFVQTFGLTVMGEMDLDPADLPLMGMRPDSPAGQLYLLWSEWAHEVARLSRSLIAEHAVKALAAELGEFGAEPLFDHMHSGIAVVSAVGGPFYRHQSGTQALGPGAMTFVAGRAGGRGVLVRGLEALRHRAGSISHGSGQRLGLEQASTCAPGVLTNVESEVFSEQYGAFRDVSEALSSLVNAGLVSDIALTTPIAQIKNPR